MIERALKKLQAKPPKSGDVLPRGGKPSLAVSEVTRVPPSDTDFQRNENGVMKRSGTPTLGMGHDWGWMPQAGMEFRNGVQTIIPLGDVGSSVNFKPDNAQAYLMNLTAPTQISFTNIDPGYEDASYNIDFLLMIENAGGWTFFIDAAYWAPFNIEPSMAGPGYYEYLVSIAVVPGRQITRGYPLIRPRETVEAV